MNRYFIEFIGKADEDLIIKYGGIIKYNYENIPLLYSILLDDTQAELLFEEQNEKIKYIKKVSKSSGKALRNWGWGYDTVNTNAYYSSGYTGKNVKVCILDTGLAYHSDLPTATLWKDFVNGGSTQYDDHEHGTFIAGIIAGQVYLGNSPDVKLYIGKILDSENRGYTDDFVAGIDWAISQNVDIINISLSTDDDNETTVIDACRRAYNAGIIVVGISGNGTINNFVARSTVNTPAKDYSVIAVGGVNENLNRASFSNYGSGLDLVAPAENLISTSSKYPYGLWRGTSFAAPFVTAHLACLKEKYPSYSRSQLINKLYEGVQDLGNNWELGRGLLKAMQSTPNIPSAPLINTSVEDGGRYEYDGTAGLALKWGSVSGATQYRVKLRRGYDNYTTGVTFSTNSGKVYNLGFGTTYFISVCAGNNNGWSDYSAENQGTTAPQTPSIYSTNVTNNSIRINLNSIVGDWSYVEIYRSNNVGTLLGTATINKSGQQYVDYNITADTKFTARAFLIIGSISIRSVNISNEISFIAVTKPTAWAWSINELNAFNNKGATSTLTYNKWNSFIDKIIEFRNYKNMPTTVVINGTTYPIISAKMVANDKALTALRFNIARQAIGEMYTTGILNVSKGDIVFGSYFITIASSLNSIA